MIPKILESDKDENFSTSYSFKTFEQPSTLQTVKRNSITYYLLIHKENRKLQLKVYVMISILLMFISFFAEDSFFVRAAERVPYLFGLPIALSHFLIGNLVQSTRALSVTVFSFVLLHLVFLVLYSILWLFDLIVSFLRRSTPNLSSFKVIRITGAAFRIFCASLIVFAAILQKTADLPESLSQEFTFREDWMSHPEIGEQTIFNLFIPGSHDSGAITGNFRGSPFFLKFIEPLSATNSHSIKQQLSMGIRYIDLRLCGAANSEANICHGPVLHYNTFESILNEVIDFSESNPSEIILIFMKPEATENVDDLIERNVYQPILQSKNYLIERSISPEEALNIPIANLTREGKRIVLASDNGSGKRIFDAIPNFWPDDFMPNTFFEERLQDRELFKTFHTENICTGNTINVGGPSGGFPQSFALLQGQMPGRVSQVTYILMPLATLLLFGTSHFENSDLKIFSDFANPVLIDLLSDPNCSAFRDFNVITHDYLSDELVELTISKNFK